MILQDLAPLEKESVLRGIPIIGPEKGFFLLEKVRELKPKRILELGTANGYSGIILASEGAELTTIEKDPKIAEEAKENFSKFHIDAKVIVADAGEEIKKLEGLFELIFIDFAKKKYVEVLEDCMRLVRKEGLIIADNISFDGCNDYKEKVLSDKRLKTQIIEIKDGLSCSEKL